VGPTSRSIAVVVTCVALCKLGTAPGMGQENPAPIPRHGNVEPVSFEDVQLNDEFWAPRLRANRETTIPHVLKYLEDRGSLDAFAILAGTSQRPYRGYMWGDSDVYKTVEGMIYTLRSHPNSGTEQRLKQIIATIVGAQAKDGYLMPHIQLAEPDYEHFSEALTRTTELYSMGHMIESAVAYFETTGERPYLDAAMRLADVILREYAPGGREWPSGHPEIELALVRLYGATGNQDYLDLAANLVERARHITTLWSQGKPSLSHDNNVGHAVAMLYLYSGAVDVARYRGDDALKNLTRRKWENLVGCKMYLTGNAGHAAHREGFARDYELPNRKAYCETCAAVANAMFNHRMFLMDGDAKYIDVLERTLYNGFLSGVSLSGDRFFYPNPLESTGQQQRSLWFGCACCPTNVVRFLPQVPGYAYAHRDGDIYVNLFVGGEAVIDTGANQIRLVQETDYPWSGVVTITIQPQKKEEFAVCVRIPGWARNEPVPSDLYRFRAAAAEKPSIAVNGRRVCATIRKGFVRIERQWQQNDKIELELPMPIRRVLSRENVAANRGRIAVERGPIVYCIEGADHEGKVLNLYLPDESQLSAQHRSAVLGGVTVLMTQGRVVDRSPDGAIVERSIDLTLIPYYAWCHRGANEMQVWIPRTKDQAEIPPVPTVASEAKVSASYCYGTDSPLALNDQREPKNSGDLSIPRLTWWSHKGTTEWAQYEFNRPYQVSTVEVYWFDDTGHGGCRVPQSWRMLYRTNEQWQPVQGTGVLEAKKDQFNLAEFKPVTTDALRIEVQLQPGFSGGILEWRVK